MEWQRVGPDWVTYTHFHKPLTSLFTLEKWHEFSYLLFCILSLPLWDINLLPASCHSDDPECLSGRRGSHPFELFSARKTVIQLEAIITKLQIIGLVTLTNLLQLLYTSLTRFSLAHYTAYNFLQTFVWAELSSISLPWPLQESSTKSSLSNRSVQFSFTVLNKSMDKIHKIYKLW